MMGFEDIRLAVETRLATWDGVPVAFDNTKTPAPDDPSDQRAVTEAVRNKEPWVRLTIQHGDSLTAGIGSQPCVRRTGLIQCQVFTDHPSPTGSAEAAQIADSLAAQLQYWQNGHLSTQAASVRRGGPTDGWYLYIVSVPFRAD
ncbi:phage tail terminator-like protein [Halomonas caseinilytica]|uniref:phage tail terminator-like protein n=1 Tax=Halomonas caseinilytica TaxID=438744 RepID=UPI0007E56672|nr:phage tail terminator-like protein [Halomonas caseinilytica]SEN64844.1 Bacteriophage related protein of unknown function [Halomonas caseinilytica]